MCGIAGFVEISASTGADGLAAQAREMADQVCHRGPDDSGEWVDQSCGLAFGHRRLSIIDLSPTGHQPMVSASGNLVLTYNGEIYNHREIRRELAGLGVEFRGTSDTEVLIEAIDQWGLVAALRRTNGMFALAVFDRRERVLLLARDRFGEKPLYYGMVGGSFAFASELRSLRVLPGFRRDVDLGSLASFLRFAYVPSPQSIHSGIFKLPAGHFLRVPVTSLPSVPAPAPFWTLHELVERAHSRGAGATDLREAVDRVEDALRRSVGVRMVADVPVGAFASGGIDSSVVVALMQAQSSRAVRTFTIGYAESEFDEINHAAAVARHLATEHTALRVTAADALSVIPLLPEMYDEPFADSSQIPTFLVSRLARESVTVALSGDGGDELFGGYTRHAVLERLWGRQARFARPVRRGVGKVVRAVPPRWWAGGASVARRLGSHSVPSHAAAKADKFGQVLQADSLDEAYSALVTAWPHPPLLAYAEADSGGDLLSRAPEGLTPTERTMFADALTYLPDDILAKVDRASMAVSLEARVPMLDHHLAEVAWSLPIGLKIRSGTSKWVLREVLARHVPRGLFERPKQGFAVPIDEWLRGPLREWGSDLLARPTLTADGLLDPHVIGAAWSAHQRGRADLAGQLWPVLMFQAWYHASGARCSG